VEPIDLFIHDSIHTPSNVRLELELAWAALTHRGILLVNGIDRGGSFAAFLARHTSLTWLIGQLGGERGEVQPGQFGIVIKRPDQ
jgi:hypothetical protein